MDKNIPFSDSKHQQEMISLQQMTFMLARRDAEVLNDADITEQE